jgi:hypothetical protein
MKLGEIARVARGVVTGNRNVFIMTRARSHELGIEAFVKSILGGARDFPTGDSQEARDDESRNVVLLASRRDVEQHPKLKAYLGELEPKLASVRIAPIAATYVGIPRFVHNPDGLVITNALYTVTPRQNLSEKETLQLVHRLNSAMQKRKKTRFAERLNPRQFDLIELD